MGETYTSASAKLEGVTEIEIDWLERALRGLKQLAEGRLGQLREEEQDLVNEIMHPHEDWEHGHPPHTGFDLYPVGENSLVIAGSESANPRVLALLVWKWAEVFDRTEQIHRVMYATVPDDVAYDPALVHGGIFMVFEGSIYEGSTLHAYTGGIVSKDLKKWF